MKKQHLFNFENYAGPTTEVSMEIAENNQPVIRSRSKGEPRAPGIDIYLKDILKIVPAGAQIQQYVGDGPDLVEMTASRAFAAAEIALEAIKIQDGHFEIVWIPHDPRVPF